MKTTAVSGNTVGYGGIRRKLPFGQSVENPLPGTRLGYAVCFCKKTKSLQKKA